MSSQKAAQGRGRERRRGWMVALIAVAVMLAVALLTTLTAAPRTALAVRAQAGAGYERWEPVIDEATDGTRAALDPLVGEPIGEVWTLSCRLEGGLGTRQVQECRLSVDLSYELAGSLPSDDELVAALEAAELGGGQTWEPSTGPAWEGRRIAGLTDGVLVGAADVAGPGDSPRFSDDVVQCAGSRERRRVVRLPGEREESETRLTVGLSLPISRTPLARDLLPGDCLVGYDRVALPDIPGYS